MQKVNLIIGITGQDGFYLTKSLLNKGQRVVGTSRNKATMPRHTRTLNSANLNIVQLNPENLNDQLDLIERVKPNNVFNLASQSSVASSFSDPYSTITSACVSVVNSLEAIRNITPQTRYYHASSSEVFGDSDRKIRSTAPFNPKSPYAGAKAAASMIIKTYRDNFGVFALNGFTFNHESIYRKDYFVTKKIINYVCELKRYGFKNSLELGNIDVFRDWGHAEEYVEAIQKLILLDQPKDCVICTGRTISLREFVKYAFEYFGFDYKKYIRITPELMRAQEIKINRGDPAEAESLIQWKADIHTRVLVDKLMTEKLNEL